VAESVAALKAKKVYSEKIRVRGLTGRGRRTRGPRAEIISEREKSLQTLAEVVVFTVPARPANDREDEIAR
jgi:hypothetical protein